MNKKSAPCILNCPAHINISGYIDLIKQKKFDDALKLIMKDLPLPGSIARICPRPCELNCNRGFKDSPVNIAQLRIFLTDMQKSFVPEIKNETGKKIAIIGGGPAGICSAYFLRGMGHSISIFDSMPQIGGMLRYGIPDYRLPKKILFRETDFLHKMNINLFCNMKINRKKFALLQNDFDAIIICIGAWKSLKMDCVGSEHFIDGIKFLSDVALNKKNIVYGKKIAVIGGGNTAIDICRTTMRLNAEKVVNIYRRTINEMPAQISEIKAAQNEGIVFKELVSPTKIIDDNGKKILVMQKYKLGEKGLDGRFLPVKIEEFMTKKFDLVILAIGQKVNADFYDGEKNFDGTIKINEFFQTHNKKVFAIGDAVNKNENAIAIRAISDAKLAASSVNNFLMNLPFDRKNKITVEILHDSNIDHREEFFEMRWTKDEFLHEAKRCLNCGGCKE